MVYCIIVGALGRFTFYTNILYVSNLMPGSRAESPTPAVGTVKISHQDSSIIHEPHKCHVRLRPSQTGFMTESSESLGFTTCGQTVEVLAYDAPYFKVRSAIHGINQVGWIYAGTTTDWQLPLHMAPHVCQLNPPHAVFDIFTEVRLKPFPATDTLLLTIHPVPAGSLRWITENGNSLSTGCPVISCKKPTIMLYSNK